MCNLSNFRVSDVYDLGRAEFGEVAGAEEKAIHARNGLFEARQDELLRPLSVLVTSNSLPLSASTVGCVNSHQLSSTLLLFLFVKKLASSQAVLLKARHSLVNQRSRDS